MFSADAQVKLKKNPKPNPLPPKIPIPIPIYFHYHENKNDTVLSVSTSLRFRESDCQLDFQGKQHLESHIVHVIHLSALTSKLGLLWTNEKVTSH